jgi:hypothetical protein
MFSFFKNKELFEKQIANRYTQFCQENGRVPSIFSTDKIEKKIASDWLNIISETVYKLISYV